LRVASGSKQVLKLTMVMGNRFLAVRTVPQLVLSV
jgi:hypothetical protein